MKISDFLKLFQPDARVVISGVFAGEMTVAETAAWVSRHDCLVDLLTCDYQHTPENSGIRMISNTMEISPGRLGRIFMDITLPEVAP